MTIIVIMKASSSPLSPLTAESPPSAGPGPFTSSSTAATGDAGGEVGRNSTDVPAAWVLRSGSRRRMEPKPEMVTVCLGLELGLELGVGLGVGVGVGLSLALTWSEG